MQVVFPKGDARPTPTMQNLIRSVIMLMAEKFNIANDPRSVEVKFQLPWNMPPDAEGATCTTPPTKAEVMFSFSLEPGLLIPVACHEMYHVRDGFNGDLKATDKGTVYRGKLYPNNMLLMAASAPALLQRALFPWETVAYDNMFLAAAEIFPKLPPELQDYVLGRSKNLRVQTGDKIWIDAGRPYLTLIGVET